MREKQKMEPVLRVKGPDDFLSEGKWKCLRCGACCQQIRGLVVQGIFSDSMMNQDGSCKYLNGKDCTIYDKRPKICHIDNQPYTDIEKAKICFELYRRVND